MKTRREFLRTLAGSCAVVAACVVAPKSLMAKKEVIQMGQDPNRLLRGMTPISNHAVDPWQTLVDPNKYNHAINGTTTTNSYPWNYIDEDGNWRRA